MKKMRRLAALFLAVVMVMAMGITAFATEETPNPTIPSGSGTNGQYELKVNSPAANHAYKVYQIYTGDVSVKENTATLSNIKKGTFWGTDADAKLTTTELNELKGKTDGMAYAKELSALITKDTAVFETLTSDSSSVQVPGGYYLIKDVWAGTGENATAPTTEQYSDFVISIVGATEFTPKTLSVPSFNKTSPVADSDLNVISDKTVGDEIPFTLTATLPDNFGSHNSYKLVFHDTLSDGLDYVTTGENAGIVVKVGDVEVEGQSAVITGRSFKYEIENVFNFNGLDKTTAAGKTITVEYYAKINSDAITRVKETNNATLEYTNGPDDDQTGTSVPSVVTVLTAKLHISKKDENDTALAGADFTLFEYNETADANGSHRGNEITSAKVAVTDDATEFNFGGLENGKKYVLAETKTPAGYNTIEDIIITVSFSAVESGGEKVMNGLTVTSEGENDLTWAVNANDATKVDTTVINRAGIQLPSTGGIGTTIFYVVGGIMVLGACVLLITKKRMSTRD